MKKGRLYTLLGFVVLVVGAAIYTVDFLYAKEQTTLASYETKSPEMGDIILKTVASGSIQPRQEILIKPQVSGIVRVVHVEAGDLVKAGDIIAEVTIVPNMSALSSAENRLSRAKISRDDALTTFERNSELFENGVVSAMEMQRFELALNQSKEEVLGAEDNLRIVREGVTSRGGSTSNTLIRSTIFGMVLDVPVKKGNSVIEANNFNDGTTVASVADMKDLIFIGKIDESEVEKLHEGMDIVLTIGAIDGSAYPATLEHISPKGVEESGAIQFEIKAAVTLEDGQFLRAGYSANADVELDRRDSVLTLSEILVQYDKRQAFVDIEIAPDTYERRDVKLGLSDGLVVEVLNGVSLEDKIKVWNKPTYE
ncbi:MAG TPA: efflux RND transporter periplasmic adaptor subunit [Flavobacteriales bacterium]|jgi:HlyD family secretion protein|nr:efflux RND transporter periplasmic adaptor subunit [Flavobacteriales bacterium]HHZ96550.1 efflux RND transporter periplasmic adaptor subunit [Flavobacteriales bacterium]HIB77889.1 efflux RND transporter periplasmic adaptor subunit [Flavobacteriales bacterium]HIN41438.1 efflux RND transporter periplasmic adaptor subunit [Flavobacteriales bacterium]HIO59562.1 efflux RND transporter periplasmic adaptor subunit [Flavobacteriales bacterium]